MTRYTSLASLETDGFLQSSSTLEGVVSHYAIALTGDLARLIDKTDSTDPIARQFLPDPREAFTAPHEIPDPTADKAHSPVTGIVHRYPDRVLLKLLHICPVYCRFCFRREQVGPEGEGVLSEAEEEAALTYIATHPAIWEVILTGGDPFMLSSRRLSRVMARLKAMDHVRIVRFHTRVPVAEPKRVTSDFAKVLTSCDKAVYVAIHANHPRELTKDAQAACHHLREAGISLLSQSVLLRGINDTPAILEQLMRRFVEMQIKPYYLHHLDPAPGTSHWEVPVEEGLALMQVLRGRLSGLAQPLYVQEQPVGRGKIPIA